MRSSLTVRGSIRTGHGLVTSGLDQVVVGDLSPETDWKPALAGVDLVVHTAARVHRLHEDAPDPVAEYRRVNAAGTLNLARQAKEAGVRRFIFLSSIKVNGETTRQDRPFTANDFPAPLDAYGIAKYEAEQDLRDLAQETGLEVVIIRPVLVYGPGVKANFLTLLRWIRSGVPLPLAAIRNQRSFVAVDNLVDLVMTCLEHPAAANQTFLVSDGEDLSTPELCRRAAAVMEVRANLFPVPAPVLRSAGRMLGRQAVVRRLCDSLQVDIAKTRHLLSWTPPVTVDAALRKTVRDL
jgi:nucleoside-diphosphate-sugar epimerase